MGPAVASPSDLRESSPAMSPARREHLQSRLLSDTETEGMMDTHALACSSASPEGVFLAHKKLRPRRVSE